MLPEKSNRILVIGGNGFFGRLLVEDLSRYCNAELVLANRRTADLQDRASLEAALDGVAIAICAAGPYQQLPVKLPSSCIERRIHYIDLADDPEFICRVRELVPKNATGLPAICTGWSTTPALSGLLAHIAAAGQESVDSLRIQMAPGNRGARNRATIASLLHSVDSIGWTSPYRFPFPPPVGLQTGYLVNSADARLFPDMFESRIVEFRAGSELRFLNASVSVLAWLRRRNLLGDLSRSAGLIQQLAGLLGGFGHDWGAVGVEARGTSSKRVSVVAHHEGPRIAVTPASIMAARLLSGEKHGGLVSYRSWLTADELKDECRLRGFELVEEHI